MRHAPPVSTPYWFADYAPSRRFPVYTRGNVGEIVPNAATPLSGSIVGPGFVHVFEEFLGSSGALTAEELDDPSASGGIFGGYLYLNLSLLRTFARRLPGMKVSDVDAQLAGTSEVPPYRAHPEDRNIRRSVVATYRMAREMLANQGRDLDAERAETVTWLGSLRFDAPDKELVAIATGYNDRFATHLLSLVDVTRNASIPAAVLERLARRAVKDDPGAIVRMLSGLGTIETAGPARDMWVLGRQVARSPSLTTAFDAGVSGLEERLEALDDTDGAEFRAAFRAFLDKHGHRGPNEVEPAVDTWGTKPEIALAAIERLRFSPTGADPEAAGRRLADERVEKIREVRARLRPPIRPVFDRVLQRAIDFIPRREQAKGTMVLSLQGLRRVLFELADRMIARGDIPDRMSLFMVTLDELPSLVERPGDFTSVLADRLARYNELNRRVPPYWFEGPIPDPMTWPVRGESTGLTSVAAGEVLTGIGVGSGIATGPARVITDPSDPGAIEPGDILVAPATDPAWTPLFLAAVAVVVDVGALQSHAAIVARELGIPAVVSVEDASLRIASGTTIEVDGDRGTVRVLEA